jgi:hypothetical protein
MRWRTSARVGVVFAMGLFLTDVNGSERFQLQGVPERS